MSSLRWNAGPSQFPETLPGSRSGRASSTTSRLAPAREGPSTALARFDEHEESGWHARVLHNLGTASPGARPLIAGTGNASGYLSTGSPIAHLGLGPTNRNRKPLGEPSNGTCAFQTRPYDDAIALR